MTQVPSRLTDALADRYRIERELENRQLVVVVNWTEELRRRTGGGQK